MKPVVVLGADGQLGRAVRAHLQTHGKAFIALGRAEADLSEPSKIRLPLEGADAVVNCAAYTNVDGAETDEKTAHLINGEAVGHIAKLCKDAGVPLVHYSTDYVFEGIGSSPLPVDAPRKPLNAYGRSKALGEEKLEQSGADYLLVRTSWVYAPWGANFVLTMKKLMAEREELRVVDDQRGRPTHVAGLAERSLGLLKGGQRGVFHVTDEGECSWFEFAQAIAEQLRTSCRISPCTTADFPRPARRPTYGVLDIAKAQAVLGPARHYRAWLAETLG